MEVMVSKRVKDKFLCRYAELDEELCRFFGVFRGGVSEYINRLNLSLSDDKDRETLAKLLYLRRARNLLAHRPREALGFLEVSPLDLRWLRRFYISIKKGKDPISRALLRRKKRRRDIITFLSLVFLTLFLVSIFIIAIIIKG